MDMLTFLSYQGISSLIGHSYVLKGLDNLMNVKGDHGRFDAWFTILEATLDGRGKMGSLVGASDDIKTLRGREAQLAMHAASDVAATAAGDNALAEYCVSEKDVCCPADNCAEHGASLSNPVVVELSLHQRYRTSSC